MHITLIHRTSFILFIPHPLSCNQTSTRTLTQHTRTQSKLGSKQKKNIENNIKANIEDALRASTAAPSLRDLSRGTLPKKI